MKPRLPGASLVALAALLACGSRTPLSETGEPQSVRFPFSGPSCGSDDPCWQCIQDSCGPATVGCVASECGALFAKTCACQPGDIECLGNLSPAGMSCASCAAGLAACAMPTCQSACGASVQSGGCPGGGATALTVACAQGVFASCGSCAYFWHTAGGSYVQSGGSCADVGGAAVLALSSCVP